MVGSDVATRKGFCRRVMAGRMVQPNVVLAGLLTRGWGGGRFRSADVWVGRVHALGCWVSTLGALCGVVVWLMLVVGRLVVG